MFLSTFSFCVVFWVRLSVWPFNFYILPLNFLNMVQLPERELSYIYFFPSSLISILVVSSVHQIPFCTGILTWFPKTAFELLPTPLYFHSIWFFIHRFGRYHVTPPLLSSFLCLPVAFSKYRLLSLAYMASDNQVHEYPWSLISVSYKHTSFQHQPTYL